MGELVETPSYRVYIPDCFCCFDDGHVFYTRYFNEMPYSYAARCYCKSGNRYSESIPLITSIYDKYEYTKRNFKNWYESYKEKREIINKLKRKGVIE